MQNNIFGTTVRDPQAMVTERARFMSRVYAWMAMGLLTTGLIAFFIGTNENLAISIARSRGLFWVLILAQFGSVIFLTAAINKISSFTATMLYGLYAALTGVTFSTLFLIYTHESIFQVFGLTSFAFAGLSAFGYFTKKDLGPVGSFCIMGLWGIIGLSLLSFFFPSLMGGQMSVVVSIIGLIVFSGLTAYDTQKIKDAYVDSSNGSQAVEKAAIFGALVLYLDFVNLFLYLLRFMGDSRRK
jgi:hypothetical protein